MVRSGLTVLVAMPCVLGCGGSERVDDAGDARDGAGSDGNDGGVDDTDTVGDEVGGDEVAPTGHVVMSTVGWSAPLVLCSTWVAGIDRDEELAAKKRVTLPPRDYHDLTRATLSTPLADVVLETGPFAGEQQVLSATPSVSWEENDPTLDADVVYDFGDLGRLTEVYRVYGRNVRLDPQSPSGSLTFLWTDAAGVRVLQPCEGMLDMEAAVAVLRLLPAEGAPPASLVAIWGTYPPEVAASQTSHILLSVSAYTTGEAPAVTEAQGHFALTYAANLPDHQEHTLVDFRRDLAAWQTRFAPEVPEADRTGVASVALSDVGVDDLGQRFGSVAITQALSGGATRSDSYRADLGWVRIDPRHLARQYGDRCPAIDDVVTLFIGALGPIERRFQLVACRRFGSPFQKHALVVIPVSWASAPEVVGVPLLGDAVVVTDDGGATVGVGGERVRIEPLADELFHVTMWDGDDDVVYDGTAPLLVLAPSERPQRVVVGTAPGLRFEAGLREVARSDDGVSWAPEYVDWTNGATRTRVSDWSRLRYRASPGNVRDTLEVDLTDGLSQRLRWTGVVEDGVSTQSVEVVDGDGSVVVPATALTSEGAPE